MSMAKLTQISSGCLEHPGKKAIFPDGTRATYCQASATLNGDTFVYGQPGLLLPPSTSWDDPMKSYLVGNDASLVTGESVIVCAGLAAIALPEGYWGWFIHYGYMTSVPVVIVTTDFDTAYVFGKVALDSNVAKIGACTTNENACIFTTTVHGTNVVTGWVNFPYVW